MKSISSALGLVSFDCKKRLKQWRDKHGLPIKKVGGRWFARRSELEAWYKLTFVTGVKQ